MRVANIIRAIKLRAWDLFNLVQINTEKIGLNGTELEMKEATNNINTGISYTMEWASIECDA